MTCGLRCIKCFEIATTYSDSLHTIDNYLYLKRKKIYSTYYVLKILYSFTTNVDDCPTVHVRTNIFLTA